MVLNRAMVDIGLQVQYVMNYQRKSLYSVWKNFPCSTQKDFDFLTAGKKSQASNLPSLKKKVQPCCHERNRFLAWKITNDFAPVLPHSSSFKRLWELFDIAQPLNNSTEVFYIYLYGHFSNFLDSENSSF